MYNDGLWYAAIARNMAAEQGSFFYPQLSQTIGEIFYHHPPLQFGIQSLFFELLGDNFYTERLYSLVVFLLAAYLMITIWKQVFAQSVIKSTLWVIPLLFWLLNEVTFNFYPANLLEGTLSVFALLAILLMYVSTTLANHRITIILLVAASWSITFAFFTKGVMGLFPVAYFSLHWLVFRNISFLNVLLQTLLVCIFPLLCFLVFYYHQDGEIYLQNYFSNQLTSSLSGIAQHHFRENRLYIIRRLLEVCSPMIIITTVTLVYQKFISQKRLHWNKYGVLFLLVGISASFPIVLSPKQSFYYLLPSIPFFALGMGIIVIDNTAHWFRQISSKNKTINFLYYLSWVAILGGLVYNWTTRNKLTGRDKQLVREINLITEITSTNTVIGSTTYSASLVGYLTRYHKVSIDTTTSNLANHQYIITDKNHDQNIPDSFVKKELKMELMDVYENQ